MGFDIVGINAKCERGEYFHNNVWWWRPLWAYICENCKDILTEKDMFEGTMNNGHKINSEKTKKIETRLRELISDERTKKYEKDYKKKLNDTPYEMCQLCNGTGTRQDKGFKGMKCNGCDGKGKKKPISTWYPFSEKNVIEFIEFITNNEGFEIC